MSDGLDPAPFVVSRVPVPLACCRCVWRTCNVKLGMRVGGAGGEVKATQGDGEV